MVMDPNTGAEPFRVFARVCDIVLVRKEDVREAAGILEPLHKVRRIARRIDEKVAARAAHEVGVCAEGRSRIEPAAPHTLGYLLRKDRGPRLRLLHFTAYGRGRTHEHRAPSGDLLLRCRRLPREHALAVSLDDEIRRDMTRRTTIDASRVDVPVTGRRVRIAGRFHAHRSPSVLPASNCDDPRAYSRDCR